MLYRAAFILVALFWVAMNALLWRAEYGQQARVGSALPPQVVWQKILTSPDSSSLTIFFHGKKIGFCHWITSVGEEFSKFKAGEAPPEGMVKRVASYGLQLEGNLVFKDFANRARFDASLRLGTNQSWEELNVRLSLRPSTIEIHSNAAEQKLRLRVGEGRDKIERLIPFSALQDPQALLGELGGSVGFLGEVGSANLPPRSPSWDGPKWEARNDTVKMGLAPIPAYRLQARLFDRYQVLIFVSRVGEILRVELPNDVVLVNDQVAGF